MNPFHRLAVSAMAGEKFMDWKNCSKRKKRNAGRTCTNVSAVPEVITGLEGELFFTLYMFLNKYFPNIDWNKVFLKTEIKTFTAHTSEPHRPPPLSVVEPAMLEKVPRAVPVSSLLLKLGCLPGSVPVLVLQHFKHTSCSGSFAALHLAPVLPYLALGLEQVTSRGPGFLSLVCTRWRWNPIHTPALGLLWRSA